MLTCSESSPKDNDRPPHLCSVSSPNFTQYGISSPTKRQSTYQIFGRIAGARKILFIPLKKRKSDESSSIEPTNKLCECPLEADTREPILNQGNHISFYSSAENNHSFQNSTTNLNSVSRVLDKICSSPSLSDTKCDEQDSLTRFDIDDVAEYSNEVCLGPLEQTECVPPQKNYNIGYDCSSSLSESSQRRIVEKRNAIFDNHFDQILELVSRANLNEIKEMLADFRALENDWRDQIFELSRFQNNALLSEDSSDMQCKVPSLLEEKTDFTSSGGLDKDDRTPKHKTIAPILLQLGQSCTHNCSFLRP